MTTLDEMKELGEVYLKSQLNILKKIKELPVKDVQDFGLWLNNHPLMNEMKEINPYLKTKKERDRLEGIA